VREVAGDASQCGVVAHQAFERRCQKAVRVGEWDQCGHALVQRLHLADLLREAVRHHVGALDEVFDISVDDVETGFNVIRHVRPPCLTSKVGADRANGKSMSDRAAQDSRTRGVQWCIG
jgi:hypothetical protein